jgi:phage shock protein PspC (stress-responsive transcriptional regulator)
MNSEVKKLYRSNGDRKIAGICVGLGEYFDIDPLVFRLLFLFSLFFGGLGALAYLVMWIMVPPREGMPPESSARSRLHLSQADRKLAGVCGGLGEFFHLDSILFRVGFVLFAFVCGAGILLYVILWLLLPRAPAMPASSAGNAAA